MFVCNECGQLFDSPMPIPEFHGELDGCPAEYFYVCPFCLSDSYDEAHKCFICDEYITTTPFISLINGDYVCENCSTIHRSTEVL